VDPIPTLRAWAEDLGGVNFPLLSDFYPHGAIARRYGVFRAQDGHSERALFIVDKRGLVRYVDVHDIDKQPDNDVLLAQLRRIEPRLAARMAVKEEPELGEIPSEGIVMYCTSWCPACRRARRLLNERGVAYTEIDINKTAGAKDRLRELAGGNLSTPTFEINGEVIVNFRREQQARLEEILDHM
jgi:glutaredoxin